MAIFRFYNGNVLAGGIILIRGCLVKIVINENGLLDETEIIINCRQADEGIMRILAGLRMYDKKITGLRDGQTFLLNASDIFYAETVDRKTFLYTAKQVYETPLSLYELEERLV